MSIIGPKTDDGEIGQLVTPAAWIRKYITTHPKYQHDSVVSEEINYDLVKAVDEMWVDSLTLGPHRSLFVYHADP